MHVYLHSVLLTMAILEIKKDDNRQLQNIANTIAAAKKIVVITGAGISTNCGIPVSIARPSMEFVTDLSPRTFDQSKGSTLSYRHRKMLRQRRIPRVK